MQSRPTKYNLREKEPKSIFEKYQVAERDLHSDSEDGENQHKRGRRQKKVINHDDYEYDLGHQEEEEEDIFDNSEVLDKLPENREQLKELLAEVKDKLRNHKMQFLKEQQEFKCMLAIIKVVSLLWGNIQCRFAQTLLNLTSDI